MATKSKKPVSRWLFDSVCKNYQNALGKQQAEIDALERRVIDDERAKRNLIDYTRNAMTAKVTAEVERDQLKVALEIEKEARRRWEANLTAVSQRNARLQRQRELLLDVMTSAEDAGVDFSSIAHVTNPVDLTDEMQKRDTRFFNDDGGKRTA